jgi:opacity protein-like surface antigen
MKKTLILAAAALATISTAAIAAVTFDADTGTGFVGKGDVQMALNMNNRQLQDSADTLEFTYNATTVVETTWDCVNSNNQNIQERSRTTTSSTVGVVDVVARERNQITGFNLKGFDGTPTATSETEGPKLESCPNANSSFVLGSTTTSGPIPLEGGLYVNGVLLP